MLGGIAVADDNSGLIAEVRLNVRSTHSERLMSTIDYVFKQSGLTVSDIDVFAISIGPGSFTGLRIGLSTIKGFSYSTGKPIVSVPTLEAFAWNFPFSRFNICPMLDARKSEVYTAVFHWEGEIFKRLIEECSTDVERLLEDTRLGKTEKILFTGDGAILYRNKITAILGDRAVFASIDKMVPSPANVAMIGLQKATKGEYIEPVTLAPFYIRKSEAEIKKHG